MEKRRERRAQLIKLRVSESEVRTIQQHLNKSTSRSLSEYLRKLALNQPLTIKIRNTSADDFLKEVLLLRAALQQTSDTYTKAVAHLQVLQKVPELRGWLLLHESTRAALLEQVRNIEQLTLQLYEQWLRK